MELDMAVMALTHGLLGQQLPPLELVVITAVEAGAVENTHNLIDLEDREVEEEVDTVLLMVSESPEAQELQTPEAVVVVAGYGETGKRKMEGLEAQAW